MEMPLPHQPDGTMRGNVYARLTELFDAHRATVDAALRIPDLRQKMAGKPSGEAHNLAGVYRAAWKHVTNLPSVERDLRAAFTTTAETAETASSPTKALTTSELDQHLGHARAVVHMTLVDDLLGRVVDATRITTRAAAHLRNVTSCCDTTEYVMSDDQVTSVEHGVDEVRELRHVIDELLCDLAAMAILAPDLATAFQRRKPKRWRRCGPGRSQTPDASRGNWLPMQVDATGPGLDRIKGRLTELEAVLTEHRRTMSAALSPSPR